MTDTLDLTGLARPATQPAGPRFVPKDIPPTPPASAPAPNPIRQAVDAFLADNPRADELGPRFRSKPPAPVDLTGLAKPARSPKTDRLAPNLDLTGLAKPAVQPSTVGEGVNTAGRAFARGAIESVGSTVRGFAADPLGGLYEAAKTLSPVDRARTLLLKGLGLNDPVQGAVDAARPTHIDKPPEYYDTKLAPQEEAQFQAWKKNFAPQDSGEDYDLRGAFKAGFKPDPATGHWPDTFKKPNHPTFSVESQYAKDRPDLAGHWEGPNHDQYVPPAPQGVYQGALHSLSGAGQAISDVAKRPDLAAPAGWEEGWTDQIAGAFGSTAPYLVAGATGTGGSLAAGTVLGMWSGAGEAMDRAIQKGATGEQILAASRQGNFPGATEAAPMEAVFNRIPLGQWGRFAKVFGKVVASVIAEGGQEAGQQAAQNIIAKYQYDPSQEISEGTLTSFALGGLVGGGANVGAQLADAMTAEAPPPQPQPGAGAAQPPAANAGQLALPAPPRNPSLAGPGPRLALPPPAPPPTIDLQANPPAQVNMPDQSGVIAMPDQSAPVVDLPTVPEWPTTEAPIHPIENVGQRPPLRIELNEADRRRVMGEPDNSAGGGDLTGLAKPATAPGDISDIARSVRGAGVRTSPAHAVAAGDVARAEQHVAEPTPAQAEAGNYKKGHLRWQGLQLTIETPQGGTRRGAEPDGTPWESPPMPATYGYFKGSRAKDGDQVDAYVGPEPHAAQVFVIDQIEPETGKYDEPKVFVGFQNREAALGAYHGSFSDGRAGERIGAMSAMSVPDFKKWLKSGRTGMAFDAKAVAEVRRARQEIARNLKSPDAGLPKSPILNTIIKKGGVDPASPLAAELRHMGITKMPGLFRKGGMGGLDNWPARENEEFGPDAADGHGYLRPDAIMEAIREEHHGRPLRPPIIQQEMEEHAATYPLGQADEVALDAVLREYGFANDSDVRERARQLMADGADVDSAVESATTSAVKADTTDEEFHAAIPFLEDEALDDNQAGSDGGAGVREDGEVGEPGSEARAPPQREADGEPGDGQGEAQDLSDLAKPATQPETPFSPGKRRAQEAEYNRRMQEKDRSTDIGPEGKEQTVIPGAEREANASFLQRKADAPLKPKAVQKEAGGLFSDAHKQDELFAVGRARTTARDNALAIIQQVAGDDVVVNFVDKFVVPKGHVGMSKWGALASEEAAGSANKIDRLINISLNPEFETDNTAYHEAYHLIEDLKTKQERALIRRELPRLRALAAADMGMSRAVAEAVKPSEIEAQAFAAYAQGKEKGIHIGIRGFFAKLLKIIRRIRNMMQGLGYRTSEDYFDAVLRGEVQARGLEGEPEAGDQFHPAWHGTPHRFDKFSTEHIGKGEGAQAYGWGLYFASKKEIAEHYRNRLSRGITINGEQVDADYRDIGEFVKGRPPSDFGLPTAPKLTELPEGYEVGHDSSQEPDRRYHVLPPGQVHARPFEGRHPTIEAATKATLDRLNRERQTVEGDVSYHVGMVVMKALDAGDSSKAGLKKAADEYMMNQSAYVDELMQMATIKRADVGVESDKQWAEKFLRDSETGAKIAESLDIGKRSGALYRVEIPDEGSYLDWDKPLSEQPEKVKASLESVAKGGLFDVWHGNGAYEHLHGETIYKQLSQEMADKHGGKPGWRSVDGKQNDKLASEALHAAGISGIRYLDGTSRSAGEGAHNYVVFSGDDVQIEEQFSPGKRRPRRDATAVFDTPEDRRFLRRFLKNTSFGMIENGFNASASRRKLQDRADFIKRLERAIESAGTTLGEDEQLYRTESLFYGRAGELEFELRTKYVEPMMARAVAAGINRENADEFIYAAHAQERNKKIRQINPNIPDPSGMSDAEAADILRRRMGGKNASAYAALAADVQKIVNFTRDLSYNSGDISKETYDARRAQYRNYVPLRGWEDDPEESGGMASGTGFDLRSPESHQALGRRTPADSPLTYLVVQAKQAIIRSEKNKVALTLGRLVARHPNKQVWEANRAETKRRINAAGLVEEYLVPPQAVAMADREHVLVAKSRGKATYITVHDPRLLSAMRMKGASEMGALIAALSRVTSTISKLYTAYDLDFVFRNVVRDVPGALIHMGEFKVKRLRLQVLRDMPAAMTGMFRYLRGHHTDNSHVWLRYARDFAKNGGKISFFDYESLDRAKRRLDKALNRRSAVGEMQRGRPDRAAWEIARATVNLIDDLNGAVENAVRLALYVNLRRAGFSEANAASAGRELTTNFNRRGEWGPTLNAMYMFSGATIQGTVRVAQFAKRNPKSFLALAFAMAALGAGQDWLNYIISGEDPKDGINYWDKVPSYEKQRNFIIMEPGTGKYLFKFPMTYVYNIFPVFGQATSAAIRHGIGAGNGMDPLDAAIHIVSATVNAASPLDVGQSLLQTITPTILQPWMEIARGKDYKDSPIAPEKTDSTQPNYELFFKGNSPVWQVIAKDLAKWTTFDARKGPTIDWSPEWMEHVFNTYFGGAGEFWFKRIGGNLAKAINGEPIETRDFPVIRTFRGAVNDYTNQNLYYNLRDQVKRIENLNDLSPQEADKYPVEKDVINDFLASEKILGRLRRARRQIDHDPSISPTDKTAALQDIQTQMNGAMDSARAAWEQARKNQGLANSP